MIDLVSRDKYLSQMGVLPWYARKRIQGAAKTPALVVSRQEFVDDSGQLGQVSSVPPVSAGEAKVDAMSGFNSALQMLSGQEDGSVNLADTGTPLVEAEHVREAEYHESAQPLPEQLAEHSFLLRCYVIGDVLVTTEAAADGSQEMEFSYLKNVLAVCGSKFMGNGEAEKLGSFTWPVFSAGKMSGYLSSKRKDILARWLSELRLGSYKKHVHFGSSCLGDVALVRQEANLKGSFVSIEFSISEQLGMPMRKSSTWLALQPHL